MYIRNFELFLVSMNLNCVYQFIYKNPLHIIKIYSFLFACLIINNIDAQDLSWKVYPSPISTDLTHIELASDSLGIAAGKQLIIWDNDKWREFKKPSSSKISSLTISSEGTIFVCSPNKYQESELFYLQKTNWKKMSHPLVSGINTIFFKNDNYGVIAGLGEIALLKNNSWSFLPSPTFKAFLKVLIDEKGQIFALTEDLGVLRYSETWTQIKNTGAAVSIIQNGNRIYVLTDKSIGYIKDDQLINIADSKLLEKTNAFDVIEKDEFIAVGQNGLVVHYKENNWVQLESLTDEKLNAIAIVNKDSGFSVGQNGRIFHLSDSIHVQDSVQNWKGLERIRMRGFSKLVDDEYGVIIADFNNDSKMDIFTCGLFEAEHLYINKGDWAFWDEANKWGVSENNNDQFRVLNLGACAGDLDNDGYIDLYLTSLNDKNRVYKNIKGKRFEDFSFISGCTGGVDDRTNASIMGDIDNDGDLDIFIVNEYTSNKLFLNNGAGIFRDCTEEVGLHSEAGGMSATFGDIDLDGDLDLFVANWSTYNCLYRNTLTETGKLFFEDHSKSAGIQGEIHTKSNAVVFSDIDNDADLDIFVANRKSSNHLYINNGTGVFEDQTSILIGIDSFKTNSVIIEDFDGDRLKDIYLSNVGTNVFYKGQEGGSFLDQTKKYNLELEGYSTGVAIGDFDNDLDIDMYVANFIDESSMIFRNNCDGNNFIKVGLEAFKNNRRGIGSKIYTYVHDQIHNPEYLLDFREIGAGMGYASMNEQKAIIPIGKNELVDIVVSFPNGTVIEKKAITKNSFIQLSDVRKREIKKYIILNTLSNTFKNPYDLFRVFLWLLVIAFLWIFSYIGKRRYSWSTGFIIGLAIILITVYFLMTNNPKYESFWIFAFIPFSSFILILLLIGLINERKWMKMVSDYKQKEIKDKISRDLHDDLSATISTVGIYLTLIKQKINLKSDPDLKQLFDKTQSLILYAGNNVSDLVWSIKAKPESIEQFIGRIQKYYSDMFFEKGIRFSILADEGLEKQVLESKHKHNIYLIIKEALNNTIKYSSADVVKIVFKVENKKTTISISDNGVGFDYLSESNNGNGISNMKKRAEEIGAKFQIKTNPGKGCKCILELK